MVFSFGCELMREVLFYGRKESVWLTKKSLGLGLLKLGCQDLLVVIGV